MTDHLDDSVRELLARERQRQAAEAEAGRNPGPEFIADHGARLRQGVAVIVSNTGGGGYTVTEELWTGAAYAAGELPVRYVARAARDYRNRDTGSVSDIVVWWEQRQQDGVLEVLIDVEPDYYSGYSGYGGHSGYSGYSGYSAYSGYSGVTGAGFSLYTCKRVKFTQAGSADLDLNDWRGRDPFFVIDSTSNAAPNDVVWSGVATHDNGTVIGTAYVAAIVDWFTALPDGHGNDIRLSVDCTDVGNPGKLVLRCTDYFQDARYQVLAWASAQKAADDITV